MENNSKNKMDNKRKHTKSQGAAGGDEEKYEDKKVVWRGHKTLLFSPKQFHSN